MSSGRSQRRRAGLWCSKRRLPGMTSRRGRKTGASRPRWIRPPRPWPSASRAIAAIGSCPRTAERAGAGALTVNASLSFSPILPGGPYTLIVQAVAADGKAGAGANIALQAQDLSLAPGALAITLTWDTQADLDLHVIEPDGTELYWDISSRIPALSTLIPTKAAPSTPPARARHLGHAAAFGALPGARRHSFVVQRGDRALAARGAGRRRRDQTSARTIDSIGHARRARQGRRRLGARAGPAVTARAPAALALTSLLALGARADRRGRTKLRQRRRRKRQPRLLVLNSPKIFRPCRCKKPWSRARAARPRGHHDSRPRST